MTVTAHAPSSDYNDCSCSLRWGDDSDCLWPLRWGWRQWLFMSPQVEVMTVTVYHPSDEVITVTAHVPSSGGDGSGVPTLRVQASLSPSAGACSSRTSRTLQCCAFLPNGHAGQSSSPGGFTLSYPCFLEWPHQVDLNAVVTLASRTIMQSIYLSAPLPRKFDATVFSQTAK